MESIIALEGDGYVLVAADVSSSRSVVIMKDDTDKIRHLDEYKLFAAAGIPGDVTKFSEHVQKDVRLYTLRSGILMSTAAVANYTRGELARFLRYDSLISMRSFNSPVGPIFARLTFVSCNQLSF